MITENGAVEVTPDEGYALGKVTATAQVYDAVDDRVKQLVEGDIEEFTDDTITFIKSFMFAIASGTTSSVAIGSNSKLKKVNVPNVKRIGTRAFYGCTGLTTLNFPNLETIETGAFYNCGNLSEFTAPKVQTIYFDAFNSNGPRNDIKQFNFPECTTVRNDAFHSCTSLTDISIPLVKYLTDSVFHDCTALLHFDGVSVVSIAKNVFSGCSVLSAIALHKTDAVCSLSSVSSFNNTPFASTGTGGIVLVPRDLILLYQNATNWSTLYAGGKCLFWAIEDYTLQGENGGEIAWDILEMDRKAAFGIV